MASWTFATILLGGFIAYSIKPLRMRMHALLFRKITVIRTGGCMESDIVSMRKGLIVGMYDTSAENCPYKLYCYTVLFDDGGVLSIKVSDVYEERFRLYAKI